MSPVSRSLLPLLSAVLLTQCASVKEEETDELGQPQLEPLEHAELDPADPTSLDPVGTQKSRRARPAPEPAPTGLAPVAGREGRFVIRDPQGAMRVEGTLEGGRLAGLWKYYDPTGRRMAEVSYRADQRQGPVSLFYVASDGKAAGKKRMTGEFVDGTLNGFARNWYPGGGKYLERDFDRGLLQGARGWMEDGKDMSDGAAQTAAIEISRSEDALLSELESFVQLQIRQRAAAEQKE